ncbi:hypothetical protein BU24DRAFT_372682 [Aaosphaeria arxii CBS 175.79]|uniref:Uncharacterized protein n=1 Tax=Aaosphaeria arxii CBS 175.79 TaxID=1450172 RepID=A0A6A5XK59_9PLEO|nr:uncharacterized protein BU24DRAFT_372682 [Aaosphaeria arxii CBS 175.79]KAF2013343.1 hypothetical protein BU24DRAFT_372682 [Aaosphaeria arxii CBS 175.79]
MMSFDFIERSIMGIVYTYLFQGGHGLGFRYFYYSFPTLLFPCPVTIKVCVYELPCPIKSMGTFVPRTTQNGQVLGRRRGRL